MAFNSISIKATAATITAVLGLEKPNLAQDPIDQVLKLVTKKSKSGKAQKVFVYNPDATGFWTYQKYTYLYTPIMENTQLAIPVLSVFPPVTPVNFASMYTGADPKQHGIEVYEKKLVTIDTVFDALPRQGKKVALLARTDSSMGTIFKGRNIDAYNFDSDREVIEKSLELIDKDEHDVIVAYQMDYDDSIHDTEPESEASMQALTRHLNDGGKIAEYLQEKWAQYDTLFVVAADHGTHKTLMGYGDHYADTEEDMNIMHFYGFYPAK